MYPCRGLGRPLDIQETEDSRNDRQSAHEGDKAVILTHRQHLPARDIHGTQLYYRMSRPQGHSAANGNRELK
jgi:hypothetical protein